MRAIVALCSVGEADVPTYDISQSRRTGTQRLDLAGAACFVAEGLFAPVLVGRCRKAAAGCADPARTGTVAG
jgi:uridine kinase